MISGHGTIDMAINALKIGAYDFIEKPFDANILITSIKRAIEITELRDLNRELTEGIVSVSSYIGKSQSAINIRSTVDKISSTQSRVLINGSSGSGKKYLAKLIHNKSERKFAPFIIAFISGSRPITGSNFPASASAVRSLQYKSSELGVSLRLKDSCFELISPLLIRVDGSEFIFFEVGSD